MQITVNNDFSNGPRPFTQQEIDSFLQDEQTAVNILNSTFTNDIKLTFNVGFGSLQGQILDKVPGNSLGQNVSFGNVNFAKATFLTYSQLRTNLLTSGQPGFFNATTTNLPAGDSINGISNFWVTSSVAAAFGLAPPNNQSDGFIGIGTGITAGPGRVAVFLHEFGHAMGRVPDNLDSRKRPILGPSDPPIPKTPYATPRWT